VCSRTFADVVLLVVISEREHGVIRKIVRRRELFVMNFWPKKSNSGVATLGLPSNVEVGLPVIGLIGVLKPWWLTPCY